MKTLMPLIFIRQRGEWVDDGHGGDQCCESAGHFVRHESVGYD